MEKMSKPKKPVSKVKKVLNWVVSSVFGALVAVFALFQIVGMSTAITYDMGNNGHQRVNNYFGNHVMNILTDSMADIYPVGSSIIVKVKDDNMPASLHAKDNVTFIYDYYNDGNRVIVTHQLEKEPELREDGKYWYQANGTNFNANNGTIQNGKPTPQIFSEDDLIGQVVGNSIILGGMLNFITQWYGLVTILIIPSLYLIISSIVDIVKVAKENDDDDGNDPPKGGKGTNLSPEDKERLKKELLNQMLEKRTVESK